MDARTRRKLRRESERHLKEEGLDPSTCWYSIGPAKKEKPYVPVPGDDYYVETPEVQAKIDSNSWDENFDEVVAFIKQAAKETEDKYEPYGNTLKPGCIDWSWARNMDCKYVNIRIDMRDGGFVLVNQKGERISLDALKWQYRHKDEK